MPDFSLAYEDPYDCPCPMQDKPRVPHVCLVFGEDADPMIAESGEITLKFTRCKKIEDDEKEQVRYEIDFTDLVKFTKETAASKAAKKSGAQTLDDIAEEVVREKRLEGEVTETVDGAASNEAGY